MKRLIFYIKLYFKIIAQDIKTKMSYRSDFIISNVGAIMLNAVGFVSFWIIFRSFPAIAGWKYEEVMFLYSFAVLAGVPQQCLFDNNWNLRFQIYSGDFIKYCFRPVNIFFYFISEVFDIKGLGHLATGVLMMVYSWNKLELGISFVIILKLMLALFSASLIVIAITTASASACFWFINSGFLIMIVTQFRDYARYPVNIFNRFLKIFFTAIIPIAFISYYPSLMVLRSDEIPIQTWISPIVGIVFFIGSYFLWMKGAEKYSGTGS